MEILQVTEYLRPMFYSHNWRNGRGGIIAGVQWVPKGSDNDCGMEGDGAGSVYGESSEGSAEAPSSHKGSPVRPYTACLGDITLTS